MGELYFFLIYAYVLQKFIPFLYQKKSLFNSTVVPRKFMCSRTGSTGIRILHATIFGEYITRKDRHVDF